MKYLKNRIKQSLRLGNHLISFWNKNTDRIYIYDADKEEIIGSCGNVDYLKLSSELDLPLDISDDYETLYALFDDNEFELGEVG